MEREKSIQSSIRMTEFDKSNDNVRSEIAK